MEIAAIAAQQAQLQTNIALSMIKKNAQNEQALVAMIAQLAQSGRGQQVNILI